jgi:hypothetical protein
MALTLVLDSNIWLREQMLRQSAGTALRFYLHNQGARVALPEVVRLEVVINLTDRLQEASARARGSHGLLLAVMGSLKELVLPTDDDLERAAENAFDAAKISVLDISFSLKSARASLEKCIKGVPPSGPKDQQFKDGVIWADCLELADQQPVLLVTEDKGFYAERQYEKGLALNLREEAAGTRHGVSVMHALSVVLDKVRIRVEVDYNRLEAAFLPGIREDIDRMLNKHGFVLAERLSGSHKMFATDDPTTVHLEFLLSYVAEHPDGRQGVLDIQAEGRYTPATQTFADLHNRGYELKYQDVDGEKKAANIVFLMGAAVIGHRTIEHDPRVPLAD